MSWSQSNLYDEISKYYKTKYERFTDETVTINRGEYVDLLWSKRDNEKRLNHTVEALKLLRDDIIELYCEHHVEGCTACDRVTNKRILALINDMIGEE